MVGGCGLLILGVRTQTGTLTTNQMTVVAGSVGVHLKFADRIAENEARVNANDDIEGIDEGDAKERDPSVISEKVEPRQGRLDFSMDMVDVSKTLEEPLRKLMNESIAINTTAFEGTDERGVVGFVGSKTETALLAFAKNQGWDSYKPIREGAKVVQMVPFSSERKAMGVVIERPEGGYRLLLKGASEVLCRRTTRYVYVRNPAGDARPLDQSVLSDEAVPTAPFDHETRGNINRTIIFYANQSLRTIALCYRDFPSWPPPKMDLNEAGEVEYTSMAENLTLLSVVGIEDPLRPGVTEAVATCAGAGVAVKMVTGDNIITAKCVLPPVRLGKSDTYVRPTDRLRPSAASTRPAVSSWKARSSGSSRNATCSKSRLVSRSLHGRHPKTRSCSSTRSSIWGRSSVSPVTARTTRRSQPPLQRHGR